MPVDHHVLEKLSGAGFIAATGDETNFGPVGIAIHGEGGEGGLLEDLAAVHRENKQAPVRPGNGELVARGELVKPVKNTLGDGAGVDMAKNDGGA